MVKVGDRIRLLEMPNDPSPMEPGEEGVVEFISDITSISGGRKTDQVYVKWDNGRSLMLVTPPDRFMVVFPKDEEKNF